MTELEKTGEKLAKDFMNGNIREVMEYLSDDGISRKELVFLAVDVAKRLDQTAELIFRRALYNAATKD